MATLLQQAIDLAKKGQREQAERLLRQVLSSQPKNEVAWLWLSGVVRDDEQKRRALQQVLAINPRNELARKGLSLFGGTAEPPAAESPRMAVLTPEPEPPPPAAEFPFTTDFGDEDPLSFLDEEPVEIDAPASEEGGFDFGGAFPFDFTADTDDESTEAGSGLSDGSPFFSFDSEEPAKTGGFDLDDELPAFNFNFDEPADDASAESDDDLAFDKRETAQSGPFDFSMDDIPSFDFDAEPSKAAKPEARPKGGSLLKSPAPGLSPAGGDDEPAAGFDWDSPPAFDFNVDIASLATASAWEEAEPEEDTDEMAVGQSALSRLDQLSFRDEAEIDLPPVEQFPETFNYQQDPQEEEGDPEAMAIAKTLQIKQAQQRMLMALVGALVLIAVAACGLYFYIDNNLGLYGLIPSLAPAQISKEAPNPRAGEARIDFQGFPGTRARIEWTRDTTVETCSGSSGLTVDFGGDDRPTINNQVCTGEACAFERPLTSGRIKNVTVIYQCGRDASITLFK